MIMPAFLYIYNHVRNDTHHAGIPAAVRSAVSPAFFQLLGRLYPADASDHRPSQPFLCGIQSDPSAAAGRVQDPVFRAERRGVLEAHAL